MRLVLVGTLGAGFAAAVLWPVPSRKGRLARLAVGGSSTDRAAAARATVAGSMAGRVAGGVAGRVAAASLVGVAVLALLSGPVGWAVAVAVSTAVLVAVPRLPRAADRRTRARFERDLPVAADLIAACLVSGSALPACLAAVAAALGGPVGQVLAEVVAALRLGAEAASVWDPWVDHPEVGPLARVLRRSSRSGAPTAAAVEGVAQTLRASRSAAGQARAHSAGVRAVAPLGLCFLPAFLLLGVAPTVIGLATAALAG